MLEQQQSQLVAGLRELYRRLQTGEGWPGLPLDSSCEGHPLTHDILQRLDLLHSNPESAIKQEGFEENLSRLQEHLTAGSRSGGSISPDPAQIPAVSFSDAYGRHNARPTPPHSSPFLPPSQPTPVEPTTFNMNMDLSYDPSMNFEPNRPNPLPMLEYGGAVANEFPIPHLQIEGWEFLLSLERK